MLRLEGMQRSLGRRTTEALLKHEMKLKEERHIVLLQEDLLWLQKSKNNWLKTEDANTKFFHTSILVRRRRNKIEAPWNEDGEWVENGDELKKLAYDFYSNLFSLDQEAWGEFLKGRFPPNSEELKLELDKKYTIIETHRALKEM